MSATRLALPLRLFFQREIFPLGDDSADSILADRLVAVPEKAHVDGWQAFTLRDGL